eukprot:TRINITY_DN16164_c0_g1_i2.p1 TRINITY_DN16164_c0_g1~~TRINITY_DN16164_c0_g1_i2.p1  ORF type:complete len:190 (+),score=6.46 TRINITY_DN16164_c0_g1_i2:26-571(+)
MEDRLLQQSWCPETVDGHHDFTAGLCRCGRLPEQTCDSTGRHFYNSGGYCCWCGNKRPRRAEGPDVTPPRTASPLASRALEHQVDAQRQFEAVQRERDWAVSALGRAERELAELRQRLRAAEDYQVRVMEELEELRQMVEERHSDQRHDAILQAQRRLALLRASPRRSASPASPRRLHSPS